MCKIQGLDKKGTLEMIEWIVEISLDHRFVEEAYKFKGWYNVLKGHPN